MVPIIVAPTLDDIYYVRIPDWREHYTMYDDDVIEPIPCPEAFGEGGDLALSSQAALLLAVGIAAKPQFEWLMGALIETQPFSLPAIPSFGAPVPAAHFAAQVADSKRQANDVSPDDQRRRIAEDLYAERRAAGSHEAVLDLLAASLLASDELVRVAAAVSTLDLVPASGDAFDTLLVSAVLSPSDIVRAIASTALTRLEGTLGRSRRLMWHGYRMLWRTINSHRRVPQSPASLATPPDAVDACLVHGTLFGRVGTRLEEWWKPGSGDLHEYLKRGPRPGVYGASDYYRWSGGWNDYARDEAVRTLTDWVQSHGFSALDLFAHSHGANVAMLVTHRVKTRDLILMSCPVHWSVYRPNFANVRRVVSIRVKWDMVIMADRADQRFPRDSGVEEHVLPIWFGRHESARRSSTWRTQKLDDLLRAATPGAPAGATARTKTQAASTGFEQFVTVKEPLDAAERLIDALRRLPDVHQAEFRPVVFKHSKSLPQYSLLVSGTATLNEATIRSAAAQVNAEILYFQPAPW